MALTVAVRSQWVRDWAATRTEQALAEQGIHARYDVAVRLWPPTLELGHVVVDASDGTSAPEARGQHQDGASPFLEAKRVTIKPRIFALLAGKPRIDEVEIDSPRARVVINDGKVQNLSLPESKSTLGPFHAPFDVIALTDARVDLTIDDTHVLATDIDVDVSADDDVARGSSLEVAVRGGSVEVHRPRTKDGDLAFDDDQICTMDARFRIEPEGVFVRRLQLSGAVDLDTGVGPTPGCDLLANDKRNVDVTLNHVRIDYPKTKGALPSVEGHAHVRMPVGAAERLAHLPTTDGWIGADVDVRLVPGMNLPDLDGHIEAHDIALDKFHFAQDVDGEVSIHDDIVKSPRLFVGLSGGKVNITNVQIEPLAPGIPMHATAEIRDVDFTKLMVDLGVSPHPHVVWDIKEVHVPLFSGTIIPLKLDADFDAVTPQFVVYDRGVDDPAKQRIISFHDGRVGAHLAIRDGSVQFRGAHGDLPHSHVEGGYVGIFYNGAVQVDVAHADAGLEDISPIATTAMGGRVQGSNFHMMVDPKKPLRLESDATISNYSIADMSFGDVSSAHVSLTDMLLDLKNVKAKKGASVYAMPSGHIDFGKPGENSGMRVEGTVATDSFALHDMMSIFHLDEDPRFEGIAADAGADAQFSVAVGGSQDPCGGGAVNVHATTHLHAVDLFGEKFDDGDADFDMRWKDRLAGMPGAELDVHALTLHKVRHEKDGSTVGSVLGSFKTDIGGAIHGNFVLEGVPLSRVQTLGAIGADLDGSVSGIAQVFGTFDEIKMDADVDVSPVVYKSGHYGASQLHVSLLQTTPPAPSLGRTRCGGLIGGLFDKEAYLRDTSSHGEFTVTGDVAGGQIAVRKFSMSRAKVPVIAGALSLRRLDLAAVGRSLGIADAPPAGEVSGELIIDKIIQGQYASAIVRFAPSAMFVEREQKRISLRPTGAWLTLVDDTLTVSPLAFDLFTPAGLTGSISVHGAATKVTTNPQLDFDAQLMPVDLGVLVGVVDKLDAAKGTLEGSVHMTGPARDPDVEGGFHVRGGELAIKGVPGAIQNLDIDIVADTSELRISRATAKFSGGTLSITGRAPIRNLSFAGAEANIEVRGVRLTPSEGINVGMDADLTLSLGNGNAVDGRTLPKLGGDLTLTSFEYTRPINLASDLSSLGGGKSKRTVVDTYDPSLDVLSLDVRVHSRVPLRIKNNLAELSLVMEGDTLTVSGTNQRMGLRGGLKAQPGGRFRLPFGASVFEVKQAFLRFDDPTRIAPNIDVFAETEYRRGDSGSSAPLNGSTARGGSLWRIGLHAYGETDDLKIEMTSDPPLSQEDIVLLLTIGMTRAELDQLQAGALGAGAALEAFSAVSGASNAVRDAIPVIDDFRFGSAYSPKTGRTGPQVTIGKRITTDVRANVSKGLSEDNDLRANVQWRLSNRVSLQGSYDNVSDVSSSSVGNLGLDLRWRLEFE